MRRPAAEPLGTTGMGLTVVCVGSLLGSFVHQFWGFASFPMVFYVIAWSGLGFGVLMVVTSHLIYRSTGRRGRRRDDPSNRKPW